MADPVGGVQGGELQTLIATMNNMVVAIGALNKTLNASLGTLDTSLDNIFIQTTGTSTSATAGTHGAVPAQVVGYVNVNIPGVGLAKIPYFAT